VAAEIIKILTAGGFGICSGCMDQASMGKQHFHRWQYHQGEGLESQCLFEGIQIYRFNWLDL